MDLPAVKVAYALTESGKSEKILYFIFEFLLENEYKQSGPICIIYLDNGKIEIQVPISKVKEEAQLKVPLFKPTEPRRLLP